MAALSALKDRSPRWLKDGANVTTRAYARATVAQRPAPDFLIIGTKRGGTTSLFNYLLMHPGVRGLFPQSRGKKSTDYFFKELHRGPDWYRSHFHTEAHRELSRRRLGYRPVSGEASPYYLWDHRVAPEVHAVAPQVKAIALLRDPVERAWSHYHERRKNGVEPLSFTDALAAEADRLEGEAERMASDRGYYSEAHDWYTYRSRGIYLPSLENWWSVFPRDQLLVLRSEDLYADVQGTFDTVCDFLELPRHLLPDTSAFNGIAPSAIDDDRVRAELAAFYAPRNAALESALGRSLNWTGSP
ncbi:sulfotransferase domain-containing protein [Nocardioides jishulii]|uniref:Sulfotransferase domain-containing protein n=1 Tax=Nocardioides jishulii TaxID=2575440 RepID=A0A4U2YH62_9ACTN|nr:sulfotransferase domain-containing protein [Nocardioides jishulii]QCX26654.1 sulfotransferase domain-containing protein [Nocardioides jishulii]TKI60376.1 sulfotransferase domain-containing protein [Nocardioides jishulii]